MLDTQMLIGANFVAGTEAPETVVNPKTEETIVNPPDASPAPRSNNSDESRRLVSSSAEAIASASRKAGDVRVAPTVCSMSFVSIRFRAPTKVTSTATVSARAIPCSSASRSAAAKHRSR